MSIKQQLEQDGYAILRGVFFSQEIVAMRQEAAAFLSSGTRPVNGGVCAGPAPAMSALARRLANEERLSFCNGELPRQIHVHAGTFNDWHADLEPLANENAVGEPSAWMHKIVIYLQDHPVRDGFSVVPGSHRKCNHRRAALHVDSRAGDIVIFHHSVRHAGRLPNRFIAIVSWRLYRLGFTQTAGSLFWLQHFMQPKPAIPRLAIFVSFASFPDINRRHAALRAQ